MTFESTNPIPGEDDQPAAQQMTDDLPERRGPVLNTTPASAEDVAYTEAYRQLVESGIEAPTDAQVRRAMEPAA